MMFSTRLEALKRKAVETDWALFFFLVLVMNVKLVVKLVALVVFLVMARRSLSARGFFRRTHLVFYLLMVVIAIANFWLQGARLTPPYTMVMAMGMLGWLMPAAAGWWICTAVEHGDHQKMHRALTLFFLLHMVMICVSLLLIMAEIGSINPYTFKGLNQKYYISTGDYIRGITFDDAVTTAMIAGFGVLYFLFRRRFAYTLLSMLSVLVIFSNLTNIFLLLVLGFVFLFRSDAVQKSMIVVFGCLLVMFVTTVSPQNNEYVVSFVYKMIGKPYYLPPVKVITKAELKQMPDSLLTETQRREKTGLLYIDSMSNLVHKLDNSAIVSASKTDTARPTRANTQLTEYRPTPQVREKETRFAAFLHERYTARQEDSLRHAYHWEKPGKQIAGMQLLAFFKQHPEKKWLGAGTGNFSSRIAFKATALGIGGSYPPRLQYVHPFFVNGHLFVYLYYHAQWQIHHTAANTPDAAYYQLAGEYGLAGLLAFAILYAGVFLGKARGLRWGLPSLLFLLMALSIGYWFEQVSVVVLFEVLFLLDQVTRRREAQRK